MLGGQEVENEEEVGVEHVIQSPNQIKAVVHHPMARYQTRDKTTKSKVVLSMIRSRLPESGEVTELLWI